MIEEEAKALGKVWNWVHKSTSQFSSSLFRSDTTMSAQRWTRMITTGKRCERRKIGQIAITAHIYFTSCHSATCDEHGCGKRPKNENTSEDTGYVRSHLPTVVHPLNYHLIFLVCGAQTCDEKWLCLCCSSSFKIESANMSQVLAAKDNEKDSKPWHNAHFAVCVTCLSIQIDIFPI